MMKVLHLTLKKKWFDMIASGEKKEEYRELKPYWVSRLTESHPGAIGGDLMHRHKVIAYTFKTFDYIHFANGYNRPEIINIQCEGISIGNGKPDWGAEPGKEYFVIKLGERLS